MPWSQASCEGCEWALNSWSPDLAVLWPPVPSSRRDGGGHHLWGRVGRMREEMGRKPTVGSKGHTPGSLPASSRVHTPSRVGLLAGTCGHMESHGHSWCYWWKWSSGHVSRKSSQRPSSPQEARAVSGCGNKLLLFRCPMSLHLNWNTWNCVLSGAGIKATAPGFCSVSVSCPASILHVRATRLCRERVACGCPWVMELKRAGEEELFVWGFVPGISSN